MAQKSVAAPARTAATARRIYSLELATKLCPTPVQAELIVEAFGLNPVDFAGIREHTEELIARHAADLKDNLNDKALANHLQRIVGAFVGSACSSGDFYSDKVGEARRLTSRLDNDERDEDPASGFDSRADRAREFAGRVGLQAVALLAAAEGAVSAYSHITGEDWKPYEPPAAPSQSVACKSAATQIAALGG
jgi:hypothetical protein